MAKHFIFLALLLVGGFAFPAPKDEGLEVEDVSIFFDNAELDAEGRIVGGTNAAEGAFPWMGAMVSRGALLCGASLVNSRTVLTAAHCIVPALSGGQLMPTVQVTLGTNRWNSGGIRVNLRGHRNHPHYVPRTLKNDVGVLWVNGNVATTARVRPIPLSWDFIGGNVPCRVSGWGRTRTGGPLATTLQELRKNTVTGPHCVSEVARVARQLNMATIPVDPNVELCTFHSINRGTCHGDSGSALVRNSNNQQIGIVSWGLPCARGAPDVYARVSAFRGWLQTVL